MGISFELGTQYLYGLPERADHTHLFNTDEYMVEPYRLYNLDIFQHKPYSRQNLYGSIPYLTAHHEDYDVSIAWMNSAETFVDIL